MAWLNDSPDGYQGLTEGPEFWLEQSQELEPTSMDAVHIRGFGPACGLTGVPWEMPPMSDDTHIGISSGLELDPLPGGPPGKVTSQAVGNGHVQPSEMGWAQCSGEKAM